MNNIRIYKTEQLTKKSDYKCPICSLELYTNRAGYSHHLRSHKTLEYGKIQCPRCSSWKIKVAGHRKLKSGFDQRYLCHNCRRNFNGNGIIKKKEIKHRKLTKKEIYDQLYAKNHEKIYSLHVKKQKSVIKISDIIGMPYEQLRVRMHNEGIISRLSREKCHVCNMMVRNSLFERHIIAHNKNLRLGIVCPHCKSQLIHKNGTQKTRHHGIIQQYICNSCGIGFNNKKIKPKLRTDDLCRYVFLLHKTNKTWKEILGIINKKLNASLDEKTIWSWGKRGEKLRMPYV